MPTSHSWEWRLTQGLHVQQESWGERPLVHRLWTLSEMVTRRGASGPDRVGADFITGCWLVQSSLPTPSLHLPLLISLLSSLPLPPPHLRISVGFGKHRSHFYLIPRSALRCHDGSIKDLRKSGRAHLSLRYSQSKEGWHTDPRLPALWVKKISLY